MFPGRKKGKSQLVLFVLDSFANKNTWNFPFLRPVHFYTSLWTKGQKARAQIGTSSSPGVGDTTPPPTNKTIRRANGATAC